MNSLQLIWSTLAVSDVYVFLILALFVGLAVSIEKVLEIMVYGH